MIARVRVIPLVLAAIVLLTIAPAAMASHCTRCSVGDFCAPVSNWGFLSCYYDAEGCHVDLPCGNHETAVQPLAAEFTVASVERLDEPQQPKPAETLVASNDTQRSAND